jgi:hypothetical protein
MNYQEEINLEFTLKNSQKDEWISYMASHPDDFPQTTLFVACCLVVIELYEQQ